MLLLLGVVMMMILLQSGPVWALGGLITCSNGYGWEMVSVCNGRLMVGGGWEVVEGSERWVGEGVEGFVKQGEGILCGNFEQRRRSSEFFLADCPISF